MASRCTRGPIDNVSFGAPVRPAVFRILRVFRIVLMIWRVLFFQLRCWLTVVINGCFRFRYSRSDTSLLEPGLAVKLRSCRTGSNRIATSARKFPQWQSPSPTVCSRAMPGSFLFLFPAYSDPLHLVLIPLLLIHSTGLPENINWCHTT